MQSHRSLEAWKAAHVLARAGIRLARDHWRPYASGAFAQLQRATLSAQLNIAEGYARWSRPQFRQFLSIAYGSAVEAGEILELLELEGVIDPAEAKKARAAAGRCQRLLIGLLKRMQAPS